jgi:hypothetical protein
MEATPPPYSATLRAHAARTPDPVAAKLLAEAADRLDIVGAAIEALEATATKMQLLLRRVGGLIADRIQEPAEGQ